LREFVIKSVIPAKAGIQRVILTIGKLEKDLDSRFRGNDQT
jgi:hypothetical protein